MNIAQISGFKIITNDHLMVDGEPIQIRRSWRERLFSRPWRPWAAVRTFIPKIPSPQIFEWGDTLIMHSETMRKFREMSRKASN